MAQPPRFASVRAGPPYVQVKEYVLTQIQAGAWVEGQMIPSESQLAEQFGLSRMTVNRALRELTADQILHRVQGTGTFVALRKYESTVVEIRSLAQEIAERSHAHRAAVFLHRKERATDALRALFERKHGELFHSIIVHYEDGTPIQVEDRYVNPALFPEYLAQDFTWQTPNEYLTRVAPIGRVEFRIEAMMPDKETVVRLAMTPNEPCLVLNRRTWSYGHIASATAFWHPGSRYRFSGSF